MAPLQKNAAIDWTNCPLIEIDPQKLSRAPILKGTRVQADSIVGNYEGGSPVDHPEGTRVCGAENISSAARVYFDIAYPRNYIAR